MKNILFFLLFFMVFLLNCESLKEWLAEGGFNCPDECRTLPSYGANACSKCYVQNFEGEWDLEINIQNKKTLTGNARICCGEVSLGGELGIGADNCVLTGDGCSIRVSCELSSVTECSGLVVLEGKVNGDYINGSASGCDLSGTLRGERTTIAPCNNPPPPPPEKDASTSNDINQ